MTEKASKNVSSGLKSKDNSVVLDTIKKLRDEGNNAVLSELTELYENTSNKEIIDSISKLFCDLKNQDSAAIMIDFINTNKTVKTRKMIISACWQSRLDLTDYLETFINIVVSEPFELAFEAFTVIENIESKISHDRKQDLLTFAKNKILEAGEENKDLSLELVPVIETYETI